MDNDNLQYFSSTHQFDESIADSITRSNSPVLETRSTSAKSDNEASNENKTIETIQSLNNQKINIEVTYSICNVLNDLGKSCDS
ncbi:8126_t:CDS:2 [Dentiscutata erythropus]|uniref:8126_t:CDS:1 n=1 Tax=Dentiscutata erythropus TaxID=1348616 RepID=A0A9N9J2K0_9GLOM|nr:8126_t:CDS:2 [Dentiscutata erythropus]